MGADANGLVSDIGVELVPRLGSQHALVVFKLRLRAGPKADRRVDEPIQIEAGAVGTVMRELKQIALEICAVGIGHLLAERLFAVAQQHDRFAARGVFPNSRS